NLFILYVGIKEDQFQQGPDSMSLGGYSDVFNMCNILIPVHKSECGLFLNLSEDLDNRLVLHFQYDINFINILVSFG
ncbi:MAG TPA: hypothetical protein VK625_19485, partial [Flavitalea sp.]|nr:hypothetical protein [Flavitalea sp.]